MFSFRIVFLLFTFLFFKNQPNFIFFILEKYKTNGEWNLKCLFVYCFVMGFNMFILVLIRVWSVKCVRKILVWLRDCKRGESQHFPW